MLKNISILLLILFVITACASAGNRIDRTHLDDVANGVQDKTQIRQWFGEPYSVNPNLKGHPSGCVERWTFEYAKAQGFGNVTYSEILVIDFDSNGRVCDHAFSKTGSD